MLLRRRSRAASGSRPQGSRCPRAATQALERIWTLVADDDGTLYAGGDPGVLFASRDGGATWELNRALWEHPTRPDWQPGGGGLCLHSIVPTPGEPGQARARHLGRRRLADRRRRRDLAPRQPGHPPALPARRRARGHDRRSASTTSSARPKRPERLFMQFHGGVYRSDDARRELDLHRRRPAVGLRLPARGRPRRPRQRLRDPAEGRHGPRDARGPRARLRDARRGRDAGRRAATGCRPSTRT